MSDTTLVRIGRTLAVYAVVAGVAGSVLYLVLGLGELLLRDWVVHGTAISAPAGVLTWLVVRRHARNGAVWALLLAAAFNATSVLTLGLAQWQLAVLGLPADLHVLVPAELPVTTALLLQIQSGVWIPGTFLIFTFGLLLFPDGRLSGPRWRWAGWWSAASIGFLSLVFMWDTRPGVTIPIYRDARFESLPPEQVSLYVVGFVAVSVATAVCLIALIRRFRASSGLERQQFRWIASGASLLLVWVPLLLLGVLDTPVGLDPSRIGAMVLIPAYLAAYMVAVARYRLYEIDRIISRTVAYAVVVAALAGVYAAGVIGLGTAVSALTGVEGSDVVVAASVLAVVGLFRPVSARVQRAVDRRFNRTGYEAQQAVEALAQELRDEVDVDAIRGEVAATAATAVQPAHVSVWVADDPTRRPVEDR